MRKCNFLATKADRGASYLYLHQFEYTVFKQECTPQGHLAAWQQMRGL